MKKIMEAATFIRDGCDCDILKKVTFSVLKKVKRMFSGSGRTTRINYFMY